MLTLDKNVILAYEFARRNGYVWVSQSATRQTLLAGHVQRIAMETRSSDLSSELIVTQPGDEVELHFVPSPQGITALSAFDNRTLVVRP